MAKKLKSLNPIIGTGYKTLSTIKDGEDGNIENFPDTLPKIPRLSYKRLGVSGLEIGWEFEDKIYYTYELYGSTTKGFEASEENLMFQGLASSYFYEAKPGEKWYFKARAKNTHGRYTEFSSELVTYTVKLDNLGEYVEGGSINGALIENATINNAHIKDLHADKITAGVLDADRIGANSITANHIQANTIQSEHIQTGAITAGSGIIAEGAIGSAQISSLDAAKIEAGTIDTSKVTIQGADGHLRLKGNRMQVFQGTGNQARERVSLGDVNGNGSVYGLRVRGADGTTILLDENGVKSEGITDGAITNDKISDDANIDGAKLNINSVINKINEDGSETISGTKIEVDGTNLTTQLYEINIKQDENAEHISQAQSQITANTNAIGLKVDEQVYTADKADMTSKLEKNTSEITTMKGQIALKVEKTDIENAKSEMEGVIDTKVDSAKAEIKVTTDAISQNVSNLSQTVSTKADGSTVTTLSSKVGSLETSVNGISGKVTNLEKTTTTLGTQVSDAQDTADSAINKANNAQSTANSANSTANANKSNITNLQGEVSTVKSDIASLEVTTSGISQKVSSVESTTATLTTKVTNAQNTANTANSNATSAKNTANTANTNASSALSKAENATAEITKTNQKVSSIETNLGSITSRVSNVESKTTTIDGKVTALDSRMTSAEQKITDKAIISTVTETIDQKVNTGINNIKIGNRNLLFMDNIVNRDSSNFTKDGYTVSFTHNSEWQGIQFYNLRETLKLGVEYSLQYKIKKTSGTLTGIAQHCDSQFEIIDFRVDGVLRNATSTVSDMGINDENWHTCILRFKRKTDSTESDANRIMPQPNRGLTTVVSVEMKDFKIEEGNKVTDWNPSPEDVEKSISDTEKVLNGNIDSSVNSAKDDVLKNVGENYTAKDEFTSFSQTVNSKFEQTSKDITATFTTAQNYTKEVDGKLQSFQETVGTHIRFSSNGIDLGKTNSPFTATLDNTKLAFKQDDTEVAYISNNKMYITQAEIKDSLRIGTNTTGFFTWVQSSSGNLSLKWSDK